MKWGWVLVTLFLGPIGLAGPIRPCRWRGRCRTSSPINGRAYPSTETIHAKVGDRLLIRFIGSNSAFIHPMHIHGGPFTIVATDGVPVPKGARFEKDTVNVGPGERYDVIWTAREPGKWLLHCHINHHHKQQCRGAGRGRVDDDHRGCAIVRCASFEDAGPRAQSGSRLPVCDPRYNKEAHPRSGRVSYCSNWSGRTLIYGSTSPERLGPGAPTVSGSRTPRKAAAARYAVGPISSHPSARSNLGS